MKEALFYEKKETLLQCQLCPHGCTLSENQTGLCKVRENKAGVLYTHNYGLLSSINIDPIEKKPLYNFMPGTFTLSIGSYGCNFKCDFCQNFEISMMMPTTSQYTSEDIVKLAERHDLPSISYTYNEPTVFYEFMLDTAILAKTRGLKNIIVTNGFISEEPLKHILPYIDAMNIDLKTYNKSLYKSVCGGNFDDVIKTIKIASEYCHVEVTMLIVPNLNDSIQEMEALFKYLKHQCPTMIIHLSRYFPRYKRTEEPTSVDLLKKIKRIANQYFEKVYLGNI